MTIENLKTYLIDVVGYRDYELKGLTIAELKDMIDDGGSINDFIEFSNINFKGNRWKRSIFILEPITKPMY